MPPSGKYLMGKKSIIIICLLHSCQICSISNNKSDNNECSPISDFFIEFNSAVFFKLFINLSLVQREFNEVNYVS